MRAVFTGFRRRTFLARMGLGVGSTLLEPVARQLMAHAAGNGEPRRLAVIMLIGNGINYRLNFTPAEASRDPSGAPGFDHPLESGITDFTWPKMLESLLPHREHMLLVDGLANQSGGIAGHTSTYGALSGFTPLGNSHTSTPTSVTFDQHLATKLSGSCRFPSLLCGYDRGTSSAYRTNVFAYGKGRPARFIREPVRFYKYVFGALTEASSPRSTTRLLDALRVDINRLQSHLAGPEREQFSIYLQTMEDFDRRRAAAAGLSCNFMAPPASQATLATEDQLQAQLDIAKVALVCGLTNVVGFASGTGGSHGHFPSYTKIAAKVDEAYQDQPGQLGGAQHAKDPMHQAQMNVIHDFHAGLLGRLAAALAAIPHQDGSLFDVSTMLYTSDNGEAHHAVKERWPAVVLSGPRNKLKTGGRFVRFAPKGTAGGGRALCDLFSTLMVSMGLPEEEFGKGGTEPTKGPISALLKT